MSEPAWVELLGAPFRRGGRDPEKGLDCLGVAVEFYRRIGMPGLVPDPRGGWKDVIRGEDRIGEGLRGRGWRPVRRGDLQPGHLIVLDWHGTGYADHVAIYVGEGRMLHASDPAGTQAVPLSVIEAHGARWLGSYAPPRPIPGDRSTEKPLALQAPSEAACSGMARLILVRDPLMSPRDRTVMEVPAGLRIGGLVPLEWRKTARRQVVALGADGEVLDEDALTKPGGTVALMLAPAGSSLVAGLILGALNFVVQLALAPDIAKPDDSGEIASPTFDLSGIRNTATTGIPIPVVYGQHVVGGNVISIFFTADEDGRQILNMLLALSQGPIIDIAGLQGEQDGLRGASIPDEIKINGTAASEFQNVRVSTRLGTEDQTPIPGFSQSVTAVPYEITLGQFEPFTHTTGEVDAVQVLINFPAGLYTASQSGGQNARPAQFAVRWRPVGTTTWSTRTVNYSEARRAAFTKQINVDGLARGSYEVQVERLLPEWPPNTTSEVDQSDLVAINEVTDDALSYPGIALLAVQAMSDEQLPGGAPPTITSIVRGRRVYRYAAAASGGNEFLPASATDDSYRVPAWVTFDLLTNPTYGLAVNGNLTVDNVDLASFTEWETLTQTSVESGQGDSIPRAVVNTVLDTSRGAWETIVTLARSHYADLAIIGDKVTAIPMKARNPVALFGMSQVSDWSLKYTSRSSRPNVVELDYRNEQTDYEQDTAQKVDDTIFTGIPVVEESLSVIGVTHPGQAYRYAQFRLNHAEKVGKVVQFTAGVEAIHLLPGDVIRVAHDAIAWGTSGRARTSTTNTITLDRAVTLTTGDQIVVRTDGTGEDVLQVRTVSTTGTVAAGSPITVTANWDAGDLPASSDPFSVGAPTTYAKSFQVDSIETTSDLRRTITAREYDATVFDDDPGTVETFTDSYPDVRSIPSGLRSVAAFEQSLTMDDGGVVPGVEVAISKDSLTAAVDVYWTVASGDSPTQADADSAWRYVGRTFGDSISFLGPGFGQHIVVSAVPVSPEGVSARAGSGVKTELALLGKTSVPTSAHDLTGFCVVLSGDELLLVVPEHPDRDVDEFVVFWGSVQTTIAGAMPITTVPVGDRVSIPARDYATGKYLLFAPRNRSGRYGRPYVEALNVPASVGLRLEFSQDEHSGWTGTKTDCSVSSGVLVMDAAVTTAEYESAGIAFSDGYAHRAAGIVKDFVRLEEKELTFAVAGFRFNDPRYADMTFADAYQRGYENDTPLTFADADIPFASEWCEVVTFGGHTDLIAATQPAVDIDYHNGSSWAGWDKSVPRDVAGIEQLAARLTLNAPTSGEWWRTEATGLTTLGFVRDAGKYEVADPNDDYGDGTAALTVASAVEQTGLVLRENYRRWPRLSFTAAHWVGTGATGVTPVGAHGSFSIVLANGTTDAVFVDSPTPAWAQDLDANDFINIEVTWVGDQSTGGSSYTITLITAYRPWVKNTTHTAFAALSSFDFNLTTVPAGYVAGNHITSLLRVRKINFSGAASLDGNASPQQVITTGLGRTTTLDTYMSGLGGNIRVIGMEIVSGYKVT